VVEGENALSDKRQRKGERQGKTSKKGDGKSYRNGSKKTPGIDEEEGHPCLNRAGGEPTCCGQGLRTPETKTPEGVTAGVIAGKKKKT